MKHLIALLLISSTAFADNTPADATALFEQGRKDMAAGNIEQACKAFEASLRKYTDTATKGSLAECYTTLGKVASAWGLWKELADSAPNDELRADAAKNAAAIEPRLPKYTIKLTGATPGLAVTINGHKVADPTLDVALPVDPGFLTVVASAPGYKEWVSADKLKAYEGRTVAIEIPKLAEAPKPIAQPQPTPGGAQLVVVREDTASTRRSRHIIGGSFAVAGVVALGVGAYFGSQAFSKWDEVEKLCGGQLDMCAMREQAQPISDKAKSSALTSTILMSAGGALVVIGGVIWLTAPKAERPTTALRLAPSVAPDSVGVTLSGGWR